MPGKPERPIHRQRLSPGAGPLDHQLEQILRERLLAEEFPPGALLPTEEALCQAYGVSRITVRRALDSLLLHGLIVRRRGLGSFAAERRGGMKSRLTGSLDDFLAAATELRTTCLSLESLPPPPEVRAHLRLEAEADAVLLRTLGALDEGPVVYLEIWFPPPIGGALRPADIDGQRTPVIRMVERVCNLRVSRADQVVQAGHAGPTAARHLGIAPDSPILQVCRVYYTADDRPIEVAYASYHPERYRYVIEFKAY